MASCTATFYTLPNRRMAHSNVLFLKRRPRVVLAEDHAALRKLIRESFESAGYHVTECADGCELLSVLTNADTSDLAAVVSDHRMPGMQGLDVLRALGSRRPKAPFILITAFGDDDVHKLAKDLGANLVVNKPLDEDELVETVRTLTKAS